jgi:transcriptional regulator with XRE-family HTH domain
MLGEEPPSMRTTIGERVRTYRLRRGLTQARLAHLVGRSERWLIEVERGGVDPRLSDALALARVLSVAVDDLADRLTPADERAGRPPPRRPVPWSSLRTALLIVFDEFISKRAAVI